MHIAADRHTRQVVASLRQLLVARLEPDLGGREGLPGLVLGAIATSIMDRQFKPAGT